MLWLFGLSTPVKCLVASTRMESSPRPFQVALVFLTRRSFSTGAFSGLSTTQSAPNDPPRSSNLNFHVQPFSSSTNIFDGISIACWYYAPVVSSKGEVFISGHRSGVSGYQEEDSRSK